MVNISFLLINHWEALAYSIRFKIQHTLTSKEITKQWKQTTWSSRLLIVIHCCGSSLQKWPSDIYTYSVTQIFLEGNLVNHYQNRNKYIYSWNLQGFFSMRGYLYPGITHLFVCNQRNLEDWNTCMQHCDLYIWATHINLTISFPCKWHVN